MIELHLNNPEHLPPVECAILVEVDDQLLLVERTGFIASRDRIMEYRVIGADHKPVTPEITLQGRLHWTYP